VPIGSLAMDSRLSHRAAVSQQHVLLMPLHCLHLRHLHHRVQPLPTKAVPICMISKIYLHRLILIRQPLIVVAAVSLVVRSLQLQHWVILSNRTHSSILVPSIRRILLRHSIPVCLIHHLVDLVRNASPHVRMQLFLLPLYHTLIPVHHQCHLYLSVSPHVKRHYYMDANT